MKIVVTRTLPGCPETLLNRHFDDVSVHTGSRPMEKSALAAAVADCDVLLCTLSDTIDDSVLSQASRLKLIITYSVGLDHLDLPGLSSRGIRLVNTPDVLTDATADLAWSLILGCARRLKPAMQFLEEGKWNGFGPSLFLGIELRDKVLGIVGMGKIGKAVARRGQAFGMNLLYVNASQTDVTDFPGAGRVPLEEVMRQSDVVSLHCPLTPKTKHLISRRELNVMKPQAILVNTARGAVIDEEALTAHLRSHPEFFAGLDVFAKEPTVPEVLRHLPNALCLPHLGSATFVAREKMGKVCLEEAIRFAKGESLKHEYRIPKN